MKKFFKTKEELLEALEEGKIIYWKTDAFRVKKFVKRLIKTYRWKIVNTKTKENISVFHSYDRIAGKITDYYYYEE
ncbi:MAG: hypothetical protein IKP65_07965 [Alphaproteobacteria bacterium]|nr:hypothetical protein [Alphaproteobacteria bacterium]